ncbi:MAG: HD domain-containing protein [Firmicutes bacterium]|nr:HD domain-containing protein [Bacillota bacterium]
MSSLERAIAIAAQAHEGQVDIAGAPYILHPLRVMLRLSGMTERIVAVLHDVLEDTSVTEEVLRNEGFSEAIIGSVQSVTRREDESYEVFVARAANDPIGRLVKMADLEDNSDLSRIANPTIKDIQRVEKYQRAMAFLRT